MLDVTGILRSCEGTLKDLCLKCGVTEAAHVTGRDSLERAEKLLKLALEALNKLDSGESPAMPEAAMSLEGSGRNSEAARAEAALRRGMGDPSGRWA